MSPLTLDLAPLGTPLTLVSAGVDPALGRRLATLGLRRGVRVALVRKLAAGGRIVAVGSGRIAIERGVLAQLQVEVAA